MPRLITADSIQRATPIPDRGIVGFDGTAPARASEQLGQGLQIAGEALANVQRLKDRADTALKLVRAKNDLHDAHDEVQRGIENGSIDPSKAEDVIKERAQKIGAQTLQGVSLRDREILQPDLEATTGALRRSVIDSAIKRQRSDIAGTIDQFGEEKSRDVMRIGPQAASEQFGVFADFAGADAGLAPKALEQVKQKFKEQAYRNFYETSGINALDQGNGTELRRLRDEIAGPGGDPIDPAQRSRLLLQFHEWGKSLDAQDKYNIASRTKDVQSMVLSGVTPPADAVPSVDDYKRAYGQSGAERWQDEVGNYVKIGGAVQLMKTASPDERARLVTDQRPEAGVGFASGLSMQNALAQAKQIVEKQIISDPASYALQNSPRVAQAYGVMQRVLNDPKQSQEDRVAVVDFYARTSEAEQLRLGVSVIRDDQTGNKARGPKLLTNDQANSISDAFNSQTTGGANAAQLIQGLEQQWGKYWPRVYGQLAADNKLPPSALVIPNMPNDASRSRMAAVAAMKPDELKALVAPGDIKDLHDKVLSEFDSAQRTFTAQGVSGNRTLATVIESADKLATLYRSQGQSVGAAAKQAYTETMGHAYTFADTYRVPNDFDARQVKLGTDAAVSQLLKDGDYKVFAGKTPEIISQDALRARSMWINTPAEDGLQLMLRGADGGVYAVQNKDGMPVRMNWADLTTKAAAARAEDNTREGNEEWFRRRQQELNPRR